LARERHGDWVTEIADRVVREAERRGGPLVVASGISPSGPIHLGNLREVLVPHFVADELRRRGLECRHVLSWDDYDRLRKVPAGVDPAFAEHIGRALTDVPDPCGEHASWSDHFKGPFRAALDALGVELTEISQTEQYTSGAYREQILLAMRNRQKIDDVLGRYRTLPKKKAAADEPDRLDTDAQTLETDAPDEDAYYPFKPYCQTCRRDTTTVTAWDDASTALEYTCSYGHAGSLRLNEDVAGKLVWKVDWPMRWAYEGVTFESGGVDHSSPGSSFTVGGELVREVFGGLPPVYVGYSFVGAAGRAKMSGSVGGAPTPGDALDILEAPMLRWVYVRRRPNQAITVAFDAEVGRLYDEWDALAARVAGGQATEVSALARDRSVATAGRTLPLTPRPLPFRTLASVADLVAGDDVQMLRIVKDLTPGDPVTDLDRIQPRLGLARAWVAGYLPAEDRTQVRDEPDRKRMASLSEPEREALTLLLERLELDWSLEGLSGLVYGVPKIQRGLPLDTPPTPELKTAQREFFALLYELLVGRDTGPRLPTLLLSLGPARIRTLLTP
jgi:lysyl-tRNA synthetase, class I